MGNGFADAALAVFTTLAPMGAAAFIVLAAAFIMGSPSDEEARRIDKLTALPVFVLLAGFVASFFHLARPLNALGVLSGVGSSPLSNEVLAGSIFIAIALVYVIVAWCGKMNTGLRKGFLIVLTLLAVVFAALCGAAYLMNTIPTWNSPFTVVQMIGYALLGGAVLGACVLECSRVELSARVGSVSLIIAVTGLALGALGFGAQIAGLGSICNIWGSAANLVPGIGGIFACFVVCGIIGVGLQFAVVKKSASPVLLMLACIIVAVGIFMARIGFYGLYLGIAL